jgi:hypothetical protein
MLHTGTPRYFHSLITSEFAYLIRARTCASVSPHQSPISLILPSISRNRHSLLLSSRRFFTAVVACPLLESVPRQHLVLPGGMRGPTGGWDNPHDPLG